MKGHPVRRFSEAINKKIKGRRCKAIKIYDQSIVHIEIWVLHQHLLNIFNNNRHFITIVVADTHCFIDPSIGHTRGIFNRDLGEC